MRILLFGALFAFGCRGSSSSSSASTANARAFLPAQPAWAVRVDLTRARAWPGFGKVAPLLVRDAKPLLDELKTNCQLDPIADATSLIVARTATETTIVVGGLSKDRVHGCAKPDAQLRLDGDLLSIHREAKAVASGKFLAASELVLVSRNGGALDAAAWKADEAKPRTVPPWVATLDAPASAWIVTGARKLLAKSELVDPLVVKASIASASLETAKRDQQLVFATSEYLTTAKAGSIVTAVTGSAVDAVLTVQPAQLDALVGLLQPLLAGEPMPPIAAPTTPADPNAGSAGSGSAEPELPIDPKIAIDCTGLKGSIAKYLEASVKASPPAGRSQMQAIADKLRPELERVFNQRCVSDQWTVDSIRCHIASAYAGKLARFERCQLTALQRTNLDADLKAVMSSVGIAPITKDTVQKESGSAGK